MGKTRVVIKSAASGRSPSVNVEGKDVSSMKMGVDEHEDLDWKHYAQLLRKELITSKMKPVKLIRKNNNKPPSEAQLLSRANFKDKVVEAKKIFDDGHAGLLWKDCMSRVYREAKEKADKVALAAAAAAVAETHKVHSTIHVQTVK
jgi:hypothetical protein